MKNAVLLNNFFHRSPAFKYCLFILLTLFTLVNISHAQNCEPGQLVWTNNQPITIDGFANEAAWSRVQPNYLNSVTVPSMQPDFPGTYWKGMWDATNLYIFIFVRDTVIVPGNGPNPTFYQDDAIEIFVGGAGVPASSMPPPTYTPFDHQFGFSLGTNAGTTLNPTGVTVGPGESSTSANGTTGIVYARQYVTNGYNMEIEIPWSLIGGIAPAIGKSIGFDVAVDDDDNNAAGVRDGQVSWHANNFDEYSDPSGFATVPLIQCVAPPLTVTTLSHDLTCSGINDGTASAQGAGGTPGTGATPGYLYRLNNASGPIGSFTSNNIFTGLAAGTYTITVEDYASPAATITSPNIIIKPFINPLSVNADVYTICAGSSANLTAAGGTTYTWTTSTAANVANLNTTTGANVKASPTLTTKYTITSPTSTNLVLNPDFQSGNIGFSSDYSYLDSSVLPTFSTQEVFGIVTESAAFNNTYYTSPVTTGFPDHTTGNGTGKMLVATGEVQNIGTTTNPANARVWSETIPVIPGTTYTFSYWLQQGNGTGPQALMLTKINNSSVSIAPSGAGSTNPAVPSGQWVQEIYKWVATTNTATISLYDLTTNSNSNGFAIDDISFIAPCQLTADTTIAVNPSPVAGISADTSICSGTAPVVTVTGTPNSTVTYNINGSANQTILLTPNAALDTGIASIPTSILTSNTKYILVSVAGTTSPVCSRNIPDTANITIVPLPTASIKGDTSICAGLSTNINFFNGTAGDTVTYTVDSNSIETTKKITLGIGGDTTISTGAITSITVYSLVSIKHPGISACPQNVPGTATVKIGNPPFASISGDTAICAGSPAVNITFTGTPGVTIAYTINHGTNQSLTLSAKGDTTISTGIITSNTVYNLVTASLSAFCIQSLTDSATITVNQLPLADFVINQSLCEGYAINFINGSSVSAASWAWDFGDGATSQLPNPSHTYAAAGPYAINLQVKDKNGCIGKLTPDTVIQVNPLPQAAFTIPVTCLAGGSASVQLNATNSGSATIDPLAGWQWFFDDGSSQKGVSVNYSLNSGGIHPILLVATSTAGCIDSLKQNDTAYNIPTAKDSILNSTSLCSNVPVTLINESTVGYGSITKVDIYWDYLNSANVVTDNSPTANGHYQSPYSVLTANASYEILMKVYNGNGCPPSSTQTTVTVHGTPTVQFTPLAAVCADTASIVLTEGSQTSDLTGGVGMYSGTAVSDSTFSPELAGPGTFPIVYTFTANGCSADTTQSITVYPVPLVNYGMVQSVLSGDSITLNPVNVPVAGLEYLWSPAIFLSSDTSEAPISKPVNDQSYTIKVTSPGGCSSIATLLVQVLNDFTVPNTFTPNNDGINDTWDIKELPKYPIQWVQVFDRYGQLLYESHGYSSPGWNGTYKGHSLPSGTYYYIIELNGIISPKTGYVTILK